MVWVLTVSLALAAIAGLTLAVGWISLPWGSCALVAFAVLAIIVMMAVTAEASLKPNTIPAAAAASA